MKSVGTKFEFIVVGLWGVAIVASLSTLWWYKTRPGELAPIAGWPQQAALRLQSDAQFNLVLFMHPKCECSDATVHELAHTLREAPGHVATQIVFYFPEDKSEAWAQTSLWNKAIGLPNTSVVGDLGGRIAYQFGARTSGEAFLFATDGSALFHGGITGSRGHIGDNPARRRLASVLAGKFQTGTAEFKPFGCSLFSANELTKLAMAGEKQWQ